MNSHSGIDVSNIIQASEVFHQADKIEKREKTLGTIVQVMHRYNWSCVYMFWLVTSRVSLTMRVKLTSNGPVIKMFINRWLWVLRIFTVTARSCSHVGKSLEGSQHTKKTHYDIICINYWRCDAIIWLNMKYEEGNVLSLFVHGAGGTPSFWSLVLSWGYSLASGAWYFRERGRVIQVKPGDGVGYPQERDGSTPRQDRGHPLQTTHPRWQDPLPLLPLTPDRLSSICQDEE